ISNINNIILYSKIQSPIILDCPPSYLWFQNLHKQISILPLPFQEKQTTPSMEEPPIPQPNNGFYHSIRSTLFRAAINGVERLMLDGNKHNNPRNFITNSFKNRGSSASPVSAADMLLMMDNNQYEWRMINTNHKSEPFISISSIIKLPHLLLMKFIAFHFHLLTSFFMFPIRVTSFSIATLKHAILGQLAVKNIARKLCGAAVRRAIGNGGGGGEMMKRSVRDVGVKFGRGVLWCCYVGLVLMGMVAVGFLFGSLLVNSVVEPPFQGKEALKFDYTKDSPVADVAVGIPHSRKLQITVMLMMPESDYNRKLGMFQKVRVELLSSIGKVMNTTTSPCILQFKSQPIRLAETIIKSLPILMGVMSESQMVELRMDKLSAGGLENPTASIKVSLDQRAEYRKVPGAGIPEVYVAWLKLESELPPAKRLLWEWRRTVYVWTGILLFLAELVLAFVFCRRLIVPVAGFGRKLSPFVNVFAAKKYIE
ncbi:SEI2, partial [Linum perenne]